MPICCKTNQTLSVLYDNYYYISSYNAVTTSKSNNDTNNNNIVCVNIIVRLIRIDHLGYCNWW